jgi:hypothetical protein
MALGLSPLEARRKTGLFICRVLALLDETSPGQASFSSGSGGHFWNFGAGFE